MGNTLARGEAVVRRRAATARSGSRGGVKRKTDALRSRRESRQAARQQEIGEQLTQTLQGVKENLLPSPLIDASFGRAVLALKERRFEEAAKAIDELGAHLSRFGKLVKIAIGSVAVAAEASRALGSEAPSTPFSKG